MILHFVPNHPHAVAFIKNAKSFFTHSRHVISIVNPPTTGIDYTDELNEITSDARFRRSFDIQEVSTIVLHSLFFGTDFLKKIFTYKKNYGVRLIWATWGGDYLRLARIGNFQSMADTFDALVINRSAFNELPFPKKAFIDNDTKFYLRQWETKPATSSNRANTFNVMIGNSGDESNNHIEILRKIDIKSFSKVIIPLGYNATTEYIAEIKNYVLGNVGDYEKFVFLKK